MTVFPTTVDSFTNPQSIDPLDNPPHAQQHADANDAIRAIETYVLSLSPSNQVFLNVQDFGATGDGVTDDTVAIQSTIDASSAGDCIVFPSGTYILTAPVIWKGGRRYVSLGGYASTSAVIKCSAAFVGEAMFISSDYFTNTATIGEAAIFDGLYFNGNRSAVAGTVHGIINKNWKSVFRELHMTGIAGSAIYLTSFNADNSQMGAGQNTIAIQVRGCYISSCNEYGIRIDDSTTGGQQVTDGLIVDCQISASVSAIRTDARSGTDSGAAGWIVRNNHTFTIGDSSIYLDGGFQTHVENNIVEDYGQTASAGTYYGIALLNATGKRGNHITGNTIRTLESDATGIYIGIRATSSIDGHFNISNNNLQGASAAAGIGIVTAFAGGATELKGSVVGNNVVDFTTPNQFSNDLQYLEGNSFQFTSAVPSVGTWRLGHHAWNKAPTAGGDAGWVCIAGGTPGTWIAIRPLETSGFNWDQATTKFTISGTLDSSATTLASLSVTGNTTLAGTLNSSATTLASLVVTGGTTLAGTLSASNATFNNIQSSGSTFSNTINVLAGTTVARNIVWGNPGSSWSAGVRGTGEFAIAEVGAAVRMVMAVGGNVGLGTTAVASRLHVATTVNGNTFLVTGTTGGANAIISAETTGATSKLGFWTTAGSTQAAAYTTSASTATRTIPTTVSTSSTSGATLNSYGDRINDIIAVLNNVVGDLKSYGLMK